MAASRWIPIAVPSPSGKQQYVCLNCGRTSYFPDKACPELYDGSEPDCESFELQQLQKITIKNIINGPTF